MVLGGVVPPELREVDRFGIDRDGRLLAVLPETIEQVQEILRLCSAEGVPVVARGAGTGLSGGGCVFRPKCPGGPECRTAPPAA